MENMENIYKNQIEGGAKDLEKINQEAENASSPEERDAKLAEAEQIENHLDNLEAELGINKEEVLKIYENMNPEAAEAELAEEAPEVIEALAKNDKEGAMRKLKNLPGAKFVRAAACFLAISVATGILAPNFAGKGFAQETKMNQKKEVYKNWQELLEELKENKEYSVMLQGASDEKLERMAKHPSDYGVAHILELAINKKRFRKLIKTAREKAKKEGTYRTEIGPDGEKIEKFHTKGLSEKKGEWVDESVRTDFQTLKEWANKTPGLENVTDDDIEQAIQEENQEKAESKIIQRKGVISSGEGADEDAW